MKSVDVTSKVRFEDNDGEYLPLTKCVCGKKFASWDFMISIYDDNPCECSSCGRKFYFRNAIRVYEVQDEDNQG